MSSTAAITEAGASRYLPTPCRIQRADTLTELVEDGAFVFKESGSPLGTSPGSSYRYPCSEEAKRRFRSARHPWGNRNSSSLSAAWVR